MSLGVNTMRGSVVLITNNPNLHRAVHNGRLISGSSLDVLVAVRDAVHMGSSLLTHPLCGNLRPYQQPYRSVLLKENPGALVDLESLSMIEEAVLVYRSCEDRLLYPWMLGDATRVDYAFVDCELMRESLEQYRMLPKSASFISKSVS